MYWRGAYMVYVGKLEGRRSLGRLRRRWKGNIKMYHRDVEWWGEAWAGSIWLRIGRSGELLSIRQ